VKWSETEVLKKLLKQFRTFLESTNAQTIPLDGASAGDVFKAYFAVRPPFEARADKRSEFPDAFVLSSALSWCIKNNESMYVVSADKGMRDACAKSTRLHPLPSLESFLDLITRHDSRFADLANQIFAARRAEILALIEQEFTAAGFVLVDQDGDVNDVQIERATIEAAFLLSATESSAVFDVEAEIRFTTDVSYADMDTAMYDSEERCLMPTRYIGRSTKPQNTTVSFEVVLEFEAHDPTEVEVGCNSVNRGNDIEVFADVDTQ
jgi:PIN domain